ncbi:MAG: hypothetical protein HQL68_06220 [Magnetococcales bacterium]|nr:hypothetical protein [Magnetococcales bacterium]
MLFEIEEVDSRAAIAKGRIDFVVSFLERIITTEQGNVSIEKDVVRAIRLALLDANNELVEVTKLCEDLSNMYDVRPFDM